MRHPIVVSLLLITAAAARADAQTAPTDGTPPPVQAAPTDAAPPPAQTAPGNTPPPAQAPPAPPPSAALEEFNRRYIGLSIDTRQWGVTGAGSKVVRESVIWQDRGQRKPFADVGAFLDAVGEPERAMKWRARQRVRMALMIPGGAALAAGAALIATALYLGSQPEQVCTAPLPGGGCGTAFTYEYNYNTPMLAAGGLLAGLGLVALIVGYNFQHKVTVDEAAALAERHNKRLLRSLNLEIVEGRAAPVRVTLLPSLSPRGGGLSLFGTF